MYISEIDNILNEIIDKFMYTWIIESKLDDILKFNNLIKEKKFIKHQKQINKLIDYSNSLIQDNDLNKIVSMNSNVFAIRNVILKYLCYYLFILIGIYYADTIELFNNNLIEFSRNQINYSIKIDNFFNTDSNYNIIKIINLIKELNEYANQKNNIDFKMSIELSKFINSYGKENIENLVKLINTKDNSPNYQIILNHNIIKIMIFFNLYKIDEKKELFYLIESNETTNNEFIYIDIVVPISQYIDFNIIESILTPTEIKSSLPEKIYDMINSDYIDILNEKKNFLINLDLKIQKLLDLKILVPIVGIFPSLRS